MTPCPTSSCCACPTITPRERGPAGPRPNPRSPITISPSAARSRPSRTRPSGTIPRSSSWKTTRRTAPTTWTRIAASRWSSANTRRTAPNGAPFVDSHFYSTVSVVRTMESLLGLPPMNNNDAFCSLISPLFTGPGDQPPYDADYSQPRQRPDLHGQRQKRSGRKGQHEDGL